VVTGGGHFQRSFDMMLSTYFLEIATSKRAFSYLCGSLKAAPRGEQPLHSVHQGKVPVPPCADGGRAEARLGAKGIGVSSWFLFLLV